MKLQRMPQNRTYKPGHVIKASIAYTLTHLSRMDSPTFISRTSPFPILEVLGGICNFFPYLNRKANNEDPDQTSRYVGSDLNPHCLPVSHKKNARLIWIKLLIIPIFLDKQNLRASFCIYCLTNQF